VNTFYCPYTDRDVPASETNPEHIVPLSLGGANAFTIPIDGKFNSEVGSSIDGALANDFLIKLRRRAFGVLGHSRREPKVVLKRSMIEGQSTPVQVTLRGKEGPPVVWDPVQRRDLSAAETIGKEIKSQLQIQRFNRLRFAAKVALAAGYFVYEKLFRDNLQHSDLRLLMKLNDAGQIDQRLQETDMRVWDRFTPVEAKDSGDHQMYSLFCAAVRGSCVLCIPGPKNIGFVVGVLGQIEAVLNVSANTKDFPSSGDHDLGHIILLTQKRMERLSYRSFAQRVLSQIEKPNRDGSSTS
jgi:hypothetical protein